VVGLFLNEKGMRQRNVKLRLLVVNLQPELLGRGLQTDRQRKRTRGRGQIVRETGGQLNLFFGDETLPSHRDSQGRVTALTSTPYSIDRALDGADALIAGVLVVGARAPKLVSREQVRSMGPGAVVVDVDIDQGGSVETARPTTHDDPVFVEEGVVHYGVANMPGSVPFTSTAALTAATLPYVVRLAEGGLAALREDPALAAGVNVARGRITNGAVAEAMGEKAALLGDVL